MDGEIAEKLEGRDVEWDAVHLMSAPRDTGGHLVYTESQKDASE